MEKVEAWKFETVGTACGNKSGLHKLAAAIIEIAIEEQLLPDNRKEADDDQKEEKVLYMRCRSDEQKLCSGL
jgi:hypothetical protein